ncbi:FERM domain-containing protein 8-like [Panonychus citri]|uniref:FERM domain-containing protein 8-like n=1 Tax=Panonychus citri TaxID=50023 RepID=UPI0023083625|nr:FERM domain-containing protein 8-like [Panonychus citri]
MNELETQNLSSIDELCVFLMNRIGICVSASEAATTQELVNKVIDTWFTPRSTTTGTIKSPINQHSSSITNILPKTNSSDRVTNRYPTKGQDDLIKFFTLWITSPTLELQLKPLHRPIKVLKHWESLSSKYGYTKESYFDHGSGNGAINCSSVNCEPIVSFQRNIFTQKRDEMKTTDPDVLQLLYEEAKVNVLDGRYPVDTFEQLAAIQTAIEIGPFNPKLHTSKYLKSIITQLFGSNHRPVITSTKWSTINSITSTFTQSSSLESKIINYYRRLGPIINKTQLYRNYLQLCWPLPYYGSAYFHGLIERSSKKLIALISNRLVQVWIAINPIGVHIIDEKHSRLIITLDFSKFKWELSLAANEQSTNHHRNQSIELPSIFFYFWSRNDYKKNIIKVISPQAYLINTLLNAFNDNQSGQLIYQQLNTSKNDLNFNLDHQQSIFIRNQPTINSGK